MDDANVGSIRFTRGPLTGSTFPLKGSITTIGRDATNDIIIKDDLQVSRKHIRILHNNSVWSIEKHPQSNIVTINNHHVQQAILQDNTLIGLGQDTTFVFLTQPAAMQTPAVASQQQQQIVLPPQQHYFPPASQPTPAQNATPPQSHGRPTPPLNLQGITGQISPSGTVLSSSHDGINGPLLIISTNIDNTKQTFQLDKPRMSLGKDNLNNNIHNDINVPYPIISSQHLLFERRGNDIVLIHPHPSRPKTVNGLLYKGLRILGHEHWEHTLAPGDIFRVGNEQGTLITLTYDDGAGIQEEMAPPVQDIPLRNVKELTIGRNPNNKVVLPHPQVSSYHALLTQEGGTYRITDQHSTNHVYVNNQRTADQLLKLGDSIRIGPYRLIYEGTKLTQYDESNFIRLEAHNLKKYGNNNVTLLDNISLCIPPRKFVAIVGGSGAGKSTLMDALNGLRPAHEGQVLYNGQDYYRNIPAFSTQLGYVPQDDIVHKDLTVERALYYAAKMRLPSDFTHNQIQQRINEVLEDVEMTSRRSLLVRKLSGGQRKRVSIALELLANPSVFFLDEPTSGLDPGLDRRMMLLLRKLADAGHTIVLVTHATNNIKTCDYVCFLCAGGRLAYFGPPDRANTYFGKDDFAEIYTGLEPTEENKRIPEEAEVRFKNSEEYKKYVVEPMAEGQHKQNGASGKAATVTKKRVKRGNPFTQFLLLFQRNLELLKNDKANLVVLLLQAPVIVLFLMLLVYFEVGTGLFNSNQIIQCMPQRIDSTFVTQINPSGVIGIVKPKGAKDGDTVHCDAIRAYLTSNTHGVKNIDGTTNTNGTAYAKKHGGVDKALQDFIVPGNISAQRTLFIIVFVAVVLGCINGTREIVKESSIYRRERAVNLGIVPYMLAKILMLALFALLQSAALILIVNAFEPFASGVFLPVLLETYITVVLCSLSGLMIGLAVSAFAANEDTANSLLPFVLIPEVIFAGVEIPLKDYVLQVLAVFFPTRWAMAAVGTTVGLHADKIGGDKLFGDDPTYHGRLFSIYTQQDAISRLGVSWAALGAIILGLALLIAFALKRKDVRR
jgi:ABC-type multidrug transport system ATPase subunit